VTTSYDPALIGSYTLSLWGAACPVYQIRFYLGDTDSSSWLLQDEEIAFAFAMRGNAWGAASLCALALDAKFSRLASMSADGVSQSLSNLCAQFRALSAEYQKKEAIHTAQPYLYGTSISDMLATVENRDRVPDVFRIGVFDNPPASGADFFAEGKR
jgi:hypothetical protein